MRLESVDEGIGRLESRFWFSIKEERYRSPFISSRIANTLCPSSIMSLQVSSRLWEGILKTGSASAFVTFSMFKILDKHPFGMKLWQKQPVLCIFSCNILALIFASANL